MPAAESVGPAASEAVGAVATGVTFVSVNVPVAGVSRAAPQVVAVDSTLETPPNEMV